MRGCCRDGDGRDGKFCGGAAEDGRCRLAGRLGTGVEGAVTRHTFARALNPDHKKQAVLTVRECLIKSGSALGLETSKYVMLSLRYE